MKLLTKSSYIITDSLATKNDFKNIYNFSKENISIVYISSQFSNEVKLNYDSSNKNIWNRKYVLYNGGFNYRKNVPMLIRSFANIANKFPEVDLLIIGKPTIDQLTELNNLIESFSNLKERVILKGFISDSDLSHYYSNSEAFIYPSLYEGFGIPVLEAMQCNTPVITSNRGSIPEVVGLSGIIINPDSVNEISCAISKILLDSNLQKNLKEKGLTQAKKFTWDICAENTINVYRKVLNTI
jgi:glycosyltransferase involved in cell wall biosynthesis